MLFCARSGVPMCTLCSAALVRKRNTNSLIVPPPLAPGSTGDLPRGPNASAATTIERTPAGQLSRAARESSGLGGDAAHRALGERGDGQRRVHAGVRAHGGAV